MLATHDSTGSNRNSTTPAGQQRWHHGLERVAGAVRMEDAYGQPDDVGVDRDLDGGVARGVIWLGFRDHLRTSHRGIAK
jgi:hypothetical protein